MASPTVLTFDAEGRAVDFNVCHLPFGERAHFGQYKTAKSLYDAVVARYSSPTTATLSRLMLPYLFPDLSAFAIVADLITHLCTSDTRYRAALPSEFCAKNPPPMYITFFYLVTRLPDSLSSVRDHFLSLCPTTLTVDLLEERLTTAEKSIVAVGAATARAKGARVVEGMAGAAVVEVEEAERVGVEARVVVGVGATVAAVEVVEAAAAVVEAAATAVEAVAAAMEVAEAVVLVGVELRSVEALEAASASSSRVPARPRRPSSFVSGTLAVGGLGVLVPARTFSAPTGAVGRRVEAHIRIESTALGTGEAAASGASESVAPGAGESALSGTAPAEALHTFTLDSGASRSFFRDSTTLTPLSRPVAVSLADPSGGPVLAHSSTVLPCPAVPSGSLSGPHLPSFSTNLESGAALQDEWVNQFTPGGQRVTHCTCSRTGRHLATFTRAPGSSLYTLTTVSPQVAASASAFAPGQLAAPCSCRALSHQTVLWHNHLGHPLVQRLRGMHRRVLVSGLPKVLPPLPPSPAPPCLPCVEGRQRAAPHSSSFPTTTAPLQTLHMDVWGPARVRGQDRERYFLLVVDDYSRYTTVFPLCTKGEVPDVLIPWIRATRLQLREQFGTDLLPHPFEPELLPHPF
ncbi:unnamed protein product [Closterium sp. NIES-65]|nr:unnamed protein product [Closterium sp. NIES-65]